MIKDNVLLVLKVNSLIICLSYKNLMKIICYHLSILSAYLLIISKLAGSNYLIKERTAIKIFWFLAICATWSAGIFSLCWGYDIYSIYSIFCSGFSTYFGAYVWVAAGV